MKKLLTSKKKQSEILDKYVNKTLLKKWQEDLKTVYLKCQGCGAIEHLGISKNRVVCRNCFENKDEYRDWKRLKE